MSSGGRVATEGRARVQSQPAQPAGQAEQTERRGRFAMLEALGVRDFRRLWCGNAISSIGTWMQMIGTGWLVLQLTNSPFWLGMVALARAIPVLALSLFAGVLADRVDRRRLLLITESSAGVLALALGVLTSLGVVQVWHILALAFLSATAMAFDMPAWQAMVPDLVGKERVMNAVGLNSAAFNGAAVVGPALAGFTIGMLGVAACFYLNAVSYLAVVWAIWSIDKASAGADARRNALESLREGLHYIARRRPLFALFWLATVASLLGRPYQQLMPFFAHNILGGGPRTYGALMAAAGVGALGGALLTAALGRFGHRGPLLLGSTVAFGLALIAFAYSRWLPLSLAVLVLVGGGTTLYLGATNALLQTNIPDDVRGRIMSVYSLILGGFVPLGGMLLGAAASLTGSAPLVVAVGGGLVALSGLVILALVPPLRAVD